MTANNVEAYGELQAKMSDLQYKLYGITDPDQIAALNADIERIGGELITLMEAIWPAPPPAVEPVKPQSYKIRLRMGMDQDWIYGEGDTFEEAVMAAKGKLHHRGIGQFSSLRGSERVGQTSTYLVLFKGPGSGRGGKVSATYQVEVVQEGRG